VQQQFRPKHHCPVYSTGRVCFHCEVGVVKRLQNCAIELDFVLVVVGTGDGGEEWLSAVGAFLALAGDVEVEVGRTGQAGGWV